MALLFLIFLDQICPKWIKLDQIGFPHQSKNVTIKSLHIYRKDKMAVLIFLDQICPKLDQIGFPHRSKNVTIISCHIYRKDKNSCFVFDFFWIRSVQNGSNLIKLDQIGFPHQSKNVTIKSCHIYRKDKNGCFVFDFFGSDPSKMDQTWSNWIFSPI